MKFAKAKFFLATDFTWYNLHVFLRTPDTCLMKLSNLIQKRIVRLDDMFWKNKQGKLNTKTTGFIFYKNFKIEIQKKISNLPKNMIENWHTELVFRLCKIKQRRKMCLGFSSAQHHHEFSPFSLSPLFIQHTFGAMYGIGSK